MHERVERLAASEHEQWMHWASAVLASEPGLSPARRASWLAAMVPYERLDEAAKELDRVWARKALAIIIADIADIAGSEKPHGT
jgi:hypothetical protein